MRGKYTIDTLVRVDPDQLRFAPWNPKSRIDPTSKPFIYLTDSIREHGQLMPVLINEHGLVLEGNRRVAVCRLLGISTWCIVRGNRDAFLMYQVVNDCRFDIKGKQLAEIYEVDSRALTPKQAKRIEQLIPAFGGIEKLNLFLSDKYGGSIFKAGQVAFCWRKLSGTSPDLAWDIVEWCSSGAVFWSNLRRYAFEYYGLDKWRPQELRKSLRDVIRTYLIEDLIRKKKEPEIRVNQNNGYSHIVYPEVICNVLTKQQQQKCMKFVLEKERSQEWGSQFHDLVKYFQSKGVLQN